MYWPEKACSRTRVLQRQLYLSTRIELHFSRHTAPLNVFPLDRTLEVCDAMIWQLTVVGRAADGRAADGRAADCIRRPFGLALPIGMRTGGVIQG